MTRWEYAQLNFAITEDESQNVVGRTATLRTGEGSTVLHVADGEFNVDLFNRLGLEGWEMISESVTASRAQRRATWVTLWKRPVS